MEYPYRIKVFFDTEEKTSKLATVLKINRFLSENIKVSDFTKWNINAKESNETLTYTGLYYQRPVFVGIEIAFKYNKDAILFKLGFISDGEKVDSTLLRDYREEEKGVQA